ncbi:hypothetical protein BDP81DRAFT_493201 [Colletotrichum phormii]|uniref:Uncharacterized protein n=1 Tax=Colletotrichum phormii TaxID=359342 RepID=A0AAI9ZMX3_9PEZI|nr:uncharacterized protein BDP81DRAFT_493201 [Colletotrichum phormii]KAK1634909.1 hypothetical protein BDP81DRAFT_493201 [Colletotrichum phormii]
MDQKEEEKKKEKKTVPPVDLSNEDEIEELPSSAIPAAVAAAAARAAARAAGRQAFLAGHGHRLLAALFTEGRSPALARPPVSAAPTSARPAARAVAAAAPVLPAFVATPAFRATNGLASPESSASSSSADSGSSASVGSLFDDEDLQGRSSQGLNGRASRKDHRLCKFKIYQRRQCRSKYANVYRCRGYPKNPALKNFLYCSRERKCLHKSNFKDKDGKINLKNCANCRASTQTAKIKDENEREARN